MFYRAIGLMSGTSLDGLDIAYCEFDKQNDRWTFEIKEAETVRYDDKMRDKIRSMETASADELSEFSVELGYYFGRMTRKFLEKINLTVDFVSSHGQTIFHRPDKHYTTQIGDISAICAEVKTTCVGDFRSMDVALGGQGAPLVPIGDRLLFSEYDCCLNLGGFSNISYEKNGKRTAYDICACNMVLNHLAEEKGFACDEGGAIAASGKRDKTLLTALNSLPFYKSRKAKSLGKEWVVENIFPLLQQSGLGIADKLCTYTHHIAEQILVHLKGRTLVTGGGSYNRFLTDMLRKSQKSSIEIPDKIIIDYKEALIFAFLGVLRMRNQANCLSSVTGAKQDSCCGLVVQWI